MHVYTLAKNARRAAKKAGLDPITSVRLAMDGVGFVVIAPKAAQAPTAADTAPAARGPATPRPKGRGRTSAAAAAPAAKAEKASKGARRPGNKTAVVIELLKAQGGATVEELTKATDWLPHTMRARLSGLAKAGLKIERTRAGGVTTYRAVA